MTSIKTSDSHESFPIETQPQAPFPKQCQLYLHNLAEKDIYTYIHSRFTGQVAAALGAALELPRKTIENLYAAGWLHDLGKILIPGSILQKPFALTEDEYAIMKQHVDDGIRILSGLDLPVTVINAIKYHHERWDGEGYPHHLAGKDTPIEGRILQIADAFSAMTTKRVYRDSLSPEEAMDEVRKNRGTQFDPGLADCFIDSKIWLAINSA